jgi:dihydrofolate reductase
MMLTEVDQSPEGDAHFPAFEPDHWNESARDKHDGFAFVTYQRKR